MRMFFAITVATALILGAPRLLHAQSTNLISEIKEAQAFLSGLYGMNYKGVVETKMQGRVQIGDAVLKHRALLGEAMQTKYNPYSDRFICKYEQGGRPHRPGDQGWWVLTIEVDAKHTIAEVSVGIAKH